GHSINPADICLEGASMAIQPRTVEYTDGTTRFLGHLAWDDAISGPRRAVMVSHAWAGCGDHERGRARKLAELGYVGFAIDMYGAGKIGPPAEACAAPP